jgi:hypothetical protein
MLQPPTQNGELREIWYIYKAGLTMDGENSAPLNPNFGHICRPNLTGFQNPELVDSTKTYKQQINEQVNQWFVPKNKNESLCPITDYTVLENEKWCVGLQNQ